MRHLDVSIRNYFCITNYDTDRCRLLNVPCKIGTEHLLSSVETLIIQFLSVGTDIFIWTFITDTHNMLPLGI